MIFFFPAAFKMKMKLNIEDENNFNNKNVAHLLNCA